MPLTRLRRLAAASLACAAFLAVPPALSQQAPVQPGTRVRILAPSTADTLIIGTVTAIDSAALLLSADVDTAGVHVPLAHIRRLEVAHAPHDRRRQAGLVGLVLGAVAGYALMASGCSRDPECDDMRAVGVVGGAAVGMLLGNLFGRGGGDRWRTVPTFSGGDP
ncbi:MAG TPA: hypothetical protein VGX50_18115 [Longimicrobium sp.]|nr:hypothetical protein [Longimicrobium sp.]